MANILDYCYWQFKAAQAALPSLKIEVDHEKKKSFPPQRSGWSAERTLA